MSYRTILTHLNDSRRARDLLDYAVSFARPFEARLIGLHVSARLPQLINYLQATVEKEEVTHLRAIFEDALSRESFKGTFHYGIAERVYPTAVVMTHARAADLVIASQPDPNWALSPLLDCSDDLAIESGRPVVVVPNGWSCVAPPKNVLVAWDHSRESIRALFDALPVLKNADAVEILNVHDERQENYNGSRAAREALPSSAIADVLLAHGVKPNLAIAKARSDKVGELICRRATNQQADLIVMGCYGHTRMQEMVFGGATLYAFRHMAVPVLFSH